MTMRRISDRRADNDHAKIGSENPSADDDHSITAHENFHFINPDTSMSPNFQENSFPLARPWYHVPGV